MTFAAAAIGGPTIFGPYPLVERYGGQEPLLLAKTGSRRMTSAHCIGSGPSRRPAALAIGDGSGQFFATDQNATMDRANSGALAN